MAKKTLTDQLNQHVANRTVSPATCSKSDLDTLKEIAAYFKDGRLKRLDASVMAIIEANTSLNCSPKTVREWIKAYNRGKA